MEGCLRLCGVLLMILTIHDWHREFWRSLKSGIRSQKTAIGRINTFSILPPMSDVLS